MIISKDTDSPSEQSPGATQSDASLFRKARLEAGYAGEESLWLVVRIRGGKPPRAPRFQETHDAAFSF
jgi:hypothetical protein